jgi:segregation and condensation protein A
MKPELKLVENTGSQIEHDTFELPPQQSEMPFAVVDGEPITEMPKDLYIPPDALQVFLEAFEGPLDLLLYLIRRQNLDILDIPIAEITRQYMKYIEVMAEMQLELAGEYLLMAAMLAEIKSRMLLPRAPSPEGQDEDDPRAELIRRLQEYERFKKAAEDIDVLPRMERNTLPTSVELIERKVVRMPPQVTLQEMLLAFRDVLSRAEMFTHHHVARERLSVRQRMSDILSTLRETAFLEFVRLFRAEEGRMGVTVTFIAILELMKEGLIEIVQAEPYAPIHVRPAAGSRHLTVVSDAEIDVAGEVTDADAENAAALAQPAHPDENDIDDEEDDLDIEALESTADVEASTAAGSDDASHHDVDVSEADGADVNEVDAAATGTDIHIDTAAEAEESVTDDTVTDEGEEDDNTGQGQ